MFEFTQLRCFVAVAEDLHFGRAAQRLNMTQPPLSRQIQMLEQGLGTLLFKRSSRSVQLTPAGRAFLPEARQILRLAQRAAWSAKRAARGEAGSITLGFTAGASYAVLPELLAMATRDMPNVAFVLREMRTAEQMEALATGSQDAGLIRLPVERRGMELICLARETLVLALPENHPLAQGPAPSLPDLAPFSFVMYAPLDAQYFHDLVFSLFRAADAMPNFVQHAGQVHTVLALVSAGLGVALVPESARFLHVCGVVLRELDPVPATRAELHLIWRRDNDNPALAAFRANVLQGLAQKTNSEFASTDAAKRDRYAVLPTLGYETM
jgi:DNA-binding transcriptional LysR family regulator